MFGFIKRKLAERREKKSFHDYSFEMTDFQLEKDGKIQFAQWLHPGESGHVITQQRVDFYRKFVKEGDFIIDIGANVGDTTVPMAIAAGKNGTTLGLEPNPHSFKVLAANAKLNPDKTNIIALNFAATGYDGTFTFGSGDASFGNGGIVGFTHNQKRNVRYTFEVTGKNLSAYLKQEYSTLLDKLTFVKIDAEGFDKEIIKTLVDIFQTYRPFIITECFGPSKTEEKQELFDLLIQMNYTPYRMEELKSDRKIEITRDEMSGKRTFDIIAYPKQ